MPDGSVPLLLSIIILVLLSGFFSATETAYSCASKIKLKTFSQNGIKKAEKVLTLAEDKFDNLLSTILVGNNIVNLTSATLCTLFFAKIITSENVDSSLISTIVITVSVLIFGEIIPKFIAKTYPEKTAMLFFPLIIFFYYLLFPVNLMFSGLKLVIAKIFRLKQDDVITEEEIMTVVEEAEEDGTIKKEETRLIRSVIEFDDLEVGDILVPRVNVIAINVNETVENIKNVFEREGYSRMPVYKDSIDTIIGIIHEKDLFKAYLNKEKSIDKILQKAFYTTEHVKISKLLKQLQKKKTHMAIVLDEYGGTLGLVTMEDILEELVGEIWDEHDEEINYFKKINGNTFIAEGNAPIIDTFEYFNVKTENEFSALTLSGWIIEYLGEIPSVGKTFDYLNLSFEITKATIKRILEVKIIIKETNE